MVDLHTLLFRIRMWTVLVVSVLMPGPLLAQGNIRFERISVNDGLSQSDVKSFAQDKFGFLWIGTRDGLNKYDGLEFTKYSRQKNDSTSLYFNQILDLEVDSTGNIWLGSTGGIAIYKYTNDNFENFFPSNDDFQDVDINHILLTGPHTALLSTNKGLITFNQKRKDFFITNDFALFKDMAVLRTYQDETIGLWVATNRGLFVKAPGEQKWTTLLEGNAVYDIDVGSDRRIYLGTSNGLFRYDLQTKQMTIVMQGNGPVSDIMRMKDGDLWMASNKVIVLDKNDIFKYTLAHDKFNNYSLSEDRARVLFQTRDDVVWVGTFGYGLNKFNPDIARFSYLNEQTSIPLSGNYVSTIFTTDDTTLFVGTSRGLDVINLQTKSAKHFSGDNDFFQILKIKNDDEGNIWLATSRGFQQYVNNKLVLKNSILRSVYDFAEWDAAHLVLASRTQGIYLFDKKTTKMTELIPASNLPEEVSCIRIEGAHIWVGCKDGLKLFDRQGKLTKVFKATNQSTVSLHSSFIKSLYRDSHNNLWIGTWGGGLSMLNTRDSSFTTYTVNNGLPNNVIYGMLEDRLGTLWLSTNLGLSAFSPQKLSTTNFDFFDGLQSNEFNTGAYFKSANGMFYVGGVNGLTFFDPDEILKPRTSPIILKTAVTVNNKILNAHETAHAKNILIIDHIRTSWKENDIGITFTAIDFKQSEKYSFQYSIKDTSWYDIGNRRGFELIDVPSGRYEIAVRARIPGDAWSRGVVLLAVDIVPPIWQRIWFRVVALLMFFAMALAAYRYRITRLRHANAVLNKLVHERTSEIQAKNEEIAAQNDQLQELNKELEAFSYSVSHDLRAPLRSVIGYSKMLEEDYHAHLGEDGNRILRIINQNSLRMNDLINDLLEFSKISRQGLQKSEIDMERFVKNILEDMTTSSQHKAEINVGVLPAVFADRKLLSQVWINLISNAIKYSSKKVNPVIEIGSYAEDNDIIFFVKDNGAGFDMTYVNKLFGVFQRLHKVSEFEGTGVGLALVHRIVAKHGGRVWAEGIVDHGATFYFALPKR